jgi:beta-lactamase regulating signal transducer with metallopeptidase domain
MIQAICWTLVHSLWQGLLFALITGVVMLLTRQASAAVRYNVLCIVFFLFLAVCAGTFIYESSLIGRLTEEGTLIAAADNGSWMSAWMNALGRYCSEHAVLIVWGWLFVFAIKSLRMAGSYLYTQRVRHYRINEAPEGWQARVDQLARQMGIHRAVRLVESQIVKMPLVIGHLRPMILMPLGLITGVPEAEIEAVLLHELAHIRRHDYIVNFLQNVAVNIFFFNPGFLWMSSLLREERENCCDDIAIARTQDRAGFIRALISFKEHDLRLAGVANAFPGKKNQLIKRAMRIAESTNKTLDPVEKIFLVLSFILIAALVAATSGSSPVSPAGLAQIPGGKYRFFVDTPARDVQAPVLKRSVTETAIRRIVKNKQEPLETKERVYANAAIVEANIVEAKEKVDAIDNRVMAKLAMMDAQAAQDNETAVMEKKQAMDNAMQVARDKEQAERDREQAVRDKHQAERDAQQAMADKAQAERDAEQAFRDMQQAERDAKQAEHDRTADKSRIDQTTEKKHISP